MTKISAVQAKKLQNNPKAMRKLVQDNARKTLSKTTSSKAIKTYQKTMQQLQKQVKSLQKQQSTYLKQAQSAQKQNQEWNAQQAAIDRDWQYRMSAHAHQREVADLKAAGLSPVLSANAGAPVTSGAVAQADNSMTDVLGGLASQAMSAMSQLTNSMNETAQQFASNMTSAATQMTTNRETTRAANYASDMSYYASKYASDTNYKIGKYSADLASRTSMSIAQAQNAMQERVASIQAATQQYCAKLSAETGIRVAAIQRVTAKYSADMAYKASVYGTKVNSRTTQWKTLKDNMQSELNTNSTNTTKILDTVINGAFGLVQSGVLPSTMGSLAKKFIKK